MFIQIDWLYKLSHSRRFWLTGIVYLLLMQAIALYYQYVDDFYPCALCVQIRAWVYAAIIASIFCLFIRRHFWWRWTGLTLTMVFMVGSLYTSWYAWGVEKGSIISECGIGAGFPEFMPLDQWLPMLFAADGICGESPQMWFGLSMVEGLLITLFIPVAVLFLLWLWHFNQAFATKT